MDLSEGATGSAGLRRRDKKRDTVDLSSASLTSPQEPIEPPSSHAVLTSPTAKLWLESRRVSASLPGRSAHGTSTTHTRTPTLNPPGEDRPLTLRTVRIALALVPLLWARFALLFWTEHRARLALFVLGRLVKGVLPAFKIWAASRLLDTVQASFADAARGASQIDTADVLARAGVSLAASASSTVFAFLTSSNDGVVRQYLNHHVERLYLAAQLSLDIPVLSDPLVGALMYEAGCFAGFERREARPGRMIRMGTRGPFATLNGFFQTLTSGIEVGSQAWLLWRTLHQATKDVAIEGVTSTPRAFPYNMVPIPSQSLLLIFLSFLPSLFSIFSTLSSLSFTPSALDVFTSDRKGIRKGNKKNWQTMRKEEQFIKDLGRNGAYKNEVVLFGLADWVLDKWDVLRREQIATGIERERGAGYWQLGWGVGQEAVQTLFYALLALRTFSTSVSLGSIRLYQSTAEHLLDSLKALTRSLEDSVQIMFYMAAYFEALEVKKLMDTRGRRGLLAMGARGVSADTVDYESTRQPGGMRIEARNLGFTYPGMKTPVLRDINLVVEPGTTLAIVGFNGGGECNEQRRSRPRLNFTASSSGKTTLVKVLMGLYDHTGELVINGHPASAYSPAQLHARTTVCFQDHAKYSLTLRENVGIGSIPLIDSDIDIRRAIDKGGAEGILKRIGLEGRLDRHGVPDAAGRDGPGGEGGGGGQEAGEMGGPDGGPEGFGDGPPPGPPPGSPGLRGGFGVDGLLGSGGRGGRGRGRSPPPGAPSHQEMIIMMEGMGRKQKGEERQPLSGGQWQSR